MKAFKRIFALVLSLAIITSCAFSSVVFAAEMTDVAKDHVYYKAITDLVEKGIITGYTDGSFKPEGNITRAEFCAIIARADAPAGHVFASAKSSFSDVASQAEWAIGYIEYAASRNIVNGFEDGTFRPNENVTYAQAVKMIVCALNYGTVVEKTDVWYQGYINLAMQLNLTKNAMGTPDAPAVRGLVAQLTYNMNNTAPAVQKGYDDNGNPIFGKGDNTKEEDATGTEEIQGQLIAIFGKAINGDDSGLNNKQVRVVSDGEVMKFVVGTYSMADMEEFLGYNVDIYYSEDNSGNYVIEKISKASSNNEYTVADVDVDNVTTTSIYYYDENSRKGISELKFDSEMYVLRNGGLIADGTLVNELDFTSGLGGDSGSIKFIDYDGDGDMDVAFISKYKTMYVKSVTKNSNTYTVYDKFDGTNEVFNDDTQYVTVKIANNNSNALADGALSSISTNNIISIAYPPVGTDEVEIIVSKKTASGSSSASEVTRINSNGVVVFGKNEFYTSNYYDANKDNVTYPQTMEVGDSCSVYLDFTGKIAAIDKKEIAANYGYVINVAPKSGSMDDNEVEILIYNNGVKKLSVSETGFKINGSSAEPIDLVTAIQTAASSVNANIDPSKVANGEKAVLIKYELAGNGKLKAVTTNFTNNTVVSGSFAYSSSVFNKAPDKITINDTTKVFFVPVDRTVQSGYKMGKGNLTNSESYHVHAFDIENNIAKAIVVYGQDVKIKPTAETILVKKITSVSNANGEPVKELEYYTFGTIGGEAKKYLTKESNTLDGIEPGDIIKVLLDNGVVEKVLPIFDSSEKTIYAGSEMTNNYGTEIGDGRVKYHFGTSNTNTYIITYGKVVLSPAESKGNGVMEVVYKGAADADVTNTYVGVTDAVVYSFDGDATDNEFFLKASRDAIYDEVGSETNVLVLSTSADGGYKGIIIYE